MTHDNGQKQLRSIFQNIDISCLHDPLDTLTEALGLREVTTDELATMLGVTDRRIAQLWKAGEIPEPRKIGKSYYFDLLKAVQGYIQFLKER